VVWVDDNAAGQRVVDRPHSATWRGLTGGNDVPWPRELPRPQLGIHVIVATLALNILALALPIVVLQVYDRVLPNQATTTLYWLTSGLFGVLVLDGLLRIARSNVLGYEGAKFQHVSGCRTVEHCLQSDIRSLEQDEPGTNLNRLQAIDALGTFYGGQARLVLIDLSFTLLFLFLIWYIAGPLVLAPLVLLGVLSFAAVRLGVALKESLSDRAETDNRRYGFILQLLLGFETIKLLAMEPLMLRRYERLQASTAASSHRAITLNHAAQNLGAVFSNLTLVAVAGLGSLSVMAGDLTIGGLAACILLSGRSIQPPLRALGLWTQFQNVTIAKKRAGEIFDRPLETDAGAKPVDAFRGGITFTNVNHRHDGAAAPVLHGIDLTIEPGAFIGITGGSGTGKSTLMMMMAALIKPSDGSVRFDGIDARDLDPRSLRQHIVYLPQNELFFQGTILDNLTLFGGSASVEDGLAAAATLGLDRVISRLPAGFQTTVGDGADTELPSGIKQGIAMARALASNARVLLLDEANNAFDRWTDDRLKAALEHLKGRSTIVIVSQRPSLLALADAVFELRDGTLMPWRPAHVAQIARDTSGASASSRRTA